MWAHLVLAALATACISTTLSKTTIFEPIRNRGPKLWRDLISCPWCLNHWFAPVMLVLQAGTQWPSVGEFVVALLAVIFVATLLVAILMRLFLHHEAEKAQLRLLLAAANARAGTPQPTKATP